MIDWLESTYREHRTTLFRLAWLVLRDRGLAEDAVHTAFVSLIQRPEPPENAKPYVLAAVRNAAIDLKRRRTRITAMPITTEYHPIAHSERGSTLELEELLLRLDEPKREVIEMHLRLGLSFKEIAQILDQPLSTVSSRYQRAIVELRQTQELHDG